MTKLRLGACAVRLRLYEPVSTELAAAVHPPWSESVRRLYGLQSLGDEEVDPERGEVTAGSAIAGMAERIAHRLDLAAWVVSAMEQLGWEAELDGDLLVLSKLMVPQLAFDELERAGIAGPMTALCELEGGRPRIYEGHQLE